MNAVVMLDQQPLLELRELCVNFRKPAKTANSKTTKQIAVDRVSFSIARGRTLGLVGASGAGKSSIARAIMRLVEPQSGEILLDGENICAMNASQLMDARRRMQIVFQNPSASLSPRRTIEQTLLEPLQHFSDSDSAVKREKIRQTLHTVGLGNDVLQRYPHQFSSGQQQRIAIARALVTDPDLLIADEAVSALDVSVQAQILQLIRCLQSRLGIAFLFISHDLAVIRQIADDVAVMYRGQLLEYAPVDSFFGGPAHPYSQSLLELATNVTDRTSGQQTKNGQLLTQTRRSASRDGKCIYVAGCESRMPQCETSEPEYHHLHDEIPHTGDTHCVRCHLYGSDTGNTSDG